ncbi:potassium/sodium hyperpolarization-activated cyclic nucleotide-gated channel 1 [Diachasma alloeum]|uniref:potassium/sodium hyperpolarization-activated cyclic nucleotide-gated channel 1 n=1 Tax=Diachasma alloeum TaxID=454923 RepID=UPI0007384CB3|nr:potassium/sodium hyperpolarization-activated cyclic nucleotide-gated channel 1 [Diachasma alloeum]
MRRLSWSGSSSDHVRGSSLKRSSKAFQHHCQLSKTSGSTLPRLPPNARLIPRLKRSFQKLIIISEHHPYSTYLRSRAAISAEKRRHGRSRNWWVVHPFSRLRLLWDHLMALTFVYYFITIPYVKSFSRICGRETFETSKFVNPVFGVCLADIFMSFLTGFRDEEAMEIELEPRMIARHYTGGFFLLDLITSIPYTWFTSTHLEPPGPEVNFLQFIAELIPLLKIFRISTLRHYVKQLITARGYSSVTDLTVWLSLLSVFILHWSACLTWGFPFVTLYATREKIEHSDAHVIKSGIYKENAWYIYLFSLHMGLSNIVGSNFMELMDTSMSDKVIRCILLLLGTGYLIYLIVVFLQLIESSAEPELKYQAIMSRVKEYIEDKNLSKNLGDRLIKYYEYRYQGSYFKENAIASTLSNHLRLEINVRSNRGLLETATVLHNLPRTLLANLLNSMTPTIYLENDVIYKCGDKGDCMYFISSGTVALINSMGKELDHLVDGNHFGELSLLHRNYPREVSVIAIETCELLQLHRRTFSRLIIPNSELHRRLTRISEKRLEEIHNSTKISQQDQEISKRRKFDMKKLLMRTEVTSINSTSTD